TANGGTAGATWKATLGTHTVKANVDDVNRIAESNENNNVMSKEIVVGNLPVPIRGDLNGDGNVNWADVTIAAEMAQGTTSSDAAADLNGDGTVDWKDVALLTDFFFGRTSSL
ncbi:MAG: glycosyl hydrolase, partial [Methanomicrobiales archaeon HGW-Methanomicrobiales-6]